MDRNYDVITFISKVDPTIAPHFSNLSYVSLTMLANLIILR